MKLKIFRYLVYSKHIGIPAGECYFEYELSVDLKWICVGARTV